MSEEQRPVRVRVVNTGSPKGTPQRRRNDPAVRAAAIAAELAGAPGHHRIGLVGAALFLLGCAAGGALVTGSGVLGGLGL